MRQTLKIDEILREIEIPQCGNYRKLHFVIQILREIKVGKCRVSKSAILAHLKTLNFDFVQFLDG